MKVSVVIPVYNDERTIGAAVESALAQRFDRGFEVIVVNDGSTDSTPAVLAGFGDRIRVIDQPNRGASAARNAGITAAHGEYIALLDGDDTWTADRLEKTAAVLDRNPACVAAFSNAIEVDSAGRELSHLVEPRFAHSPTLAEMLRWPWPCLPSVAIARRDAFVAIGGFREDFKALHWGGEDIFAFLLLRERGEILYLPEILCRRRRRDFRAHYANRLRHRVAIDSADAFDEFARRFEGNLTLVRLMREHFGARGRRMEAWAFDSIAGEMVTVGMNAMHEGNRGFALRCYRAAIRYRPLWLKTYCRLGWAMLPEKLTQKLSPLLTPRIRRSLAGPPTYGLQDRAP